MLTPIDVLILLVFFVLLVWWLILLVRGELSVWSFKTDLLLTLAVCIAMYYLIERSFAAVLIGGLFGFLFLKVYNLSAGYMPIDPRNPPDVE